MTSSIDAPQTRKRVLFLSDLDGTWLSRNPANRPALDQGVQKLRDEYRTKGIDLEFGYVTARPPVRVASEKLNTPDWTITYNGGFIHQGDPGHFDGSQYVVNAPLAAWTKANDASAFTADGALKIVHDLLAESKYQNLLVHTVGDVVHNPAADACPYSATICIDESSINLTPDEKTDANHNGTADLYETSTFKSPAQVTDFMNDMKQRLDDAHIQYQLSPDYLFSGKSIVMFDITTPLADKGDAVSFIARQEGIAPNDVIVSGDGGNDITMMRAKDGTDDGRRAIVVGGENDLYEAASHLHNAILEPADKDSSLAVLDGLTRQLQSISAEPLPTAS